jgi:hypothetical protein
MSVRKPVTARSAYQLRYGIADIFNTTAYLYEYDYNAYMALLSMQAATKIGHEW